jgi:hypothetical protein
VKKIGGQAQPGRQARPRRRNTAGGEKRITGNCRGVKNSEVDATRYLRLRTARSTSPWKNFQPLRFVSEVAQTRESSARINAKRV